MGMVLALASVVWAEAGPADLATVETLQNTLAAVADRVRPSVVAIVASRPLAPFDDEVRTQTQPVPPRESPPLIVPAVGSGMILTPDGWILTNEHVVRGAPPGDVTCILSNGETYRVKEINSDPRRDLAVLKIDGVGLHAVQLGDLSQVRQGHFAIVMGNPYGSASDSQGLPAMSFGIISALGRGLTHQLDPLMTERYYGNLIQTDARINPGNSGGPLLDIKGRVIGINTAISTRAGGSEGVGYAIPLDKQTKQVIQDLTQGEEVEYAFLGVALRMPTSEDRRTTGMSGKGGAVVSSVEFGTPAALAGLQVDDAVHSFDGQPVADPDELIRLVGAAGIGHQATVTYYRAGQRTTCRVTLARRKMPPPSTFTWRGMKLAYPDWEVCLAHHLPVDVRGAVIVAVEPGSPAAQAGLEIAQVVQRINGASIHGVRRLESLTVSLTGQAKLTLRGDPPRELTLP